MQITQLELKNIKSHADAEPIRFAPGVNAITGPTGAGKSTILEAIGFALFDSLPYKQNQFLREGENRGEIVVSFVDALDEREYQVVRSLGGGTPYVYDPEVKRRIVTGKQDMMEWLREHLGLEPGADLKALFVDSVGVPQGLLTAPFLENPRARKAKFDPLLQVQDYELTWEKLRETRTYLREQLALHEKHLAELGAELKRLPQLEEEAAKLGDNIAADEKRLRAIVARLEQVVTEKEALDRVRGRIQELTRDLEDLTRRLEEFVERVSEVEAAVEEAQEALQIVEDAESGYRAYEAAQARLDELEPQRLERDRLNAQLTDATGALALVEQRIDALEETLDNITKAVKRMAELEPLAAKQTKLEADLKEAERDAQRLEEAHRRVDEEQRKLEKLESHLRRVRTDLEALHDLEHEIERVDDQRRDLEQRTAILKAKQGQITEQRRQLQERLTLLESTEEAECPVCRQPLATHQAEELTEHYDAELSALDDQENEIQDQQQKSEKALATARDELTELKDKARLLPRPKREAELVEEIEAQQDVVTKSQQQEADLADANERVSSLTRGLDELGDPLGERHRLEIEANKRPEIEAGLAQAQHDRTIQEDTKSQIEKKLHAYVNLDTEFAEQREVLAANQPDHRRYLEHLKTAQSLPELSAKLETLSAEKGDVEIQQRKVRSDLTHAEGDYDQEGHQDLMEEHAELTREQAALSERLGLQREHLRKVEDEIGGLQQLQVDSREVEQEREVLNELSTALEFIRKTIREAGPYVTRVLVYTISAEADRIFGDIMNDHTMRLHWGEDYAITIEQRGNERDFSQLSGGEKMAAALAVRLALLREMSDIRLAFFDEPTAHLDDERRDNLATQITQIKGFHQLFVISHDDTFERETHHVLRVTKENEISRVEVG